jgi:hypothetical protein
VENERVLLAVDAGEQIVRRQLLGRDPGGEA